MERQQQSFHLEIFEMNENGNILDEIGLFWGKYSTVATLKRSLTRLHRAYNVW